MTLYPILQGKAFDRPEPIHYQFAQDFGLRDGDWKLVSFKGQTWELYNVGEDRTELNNLAEAEPDRVREMVEQWREMTRNVLHAERLAAQKMRPAEEPKANREWTTKRPQAAIH